MSTSFTISMVLMAKNMLGPATKEAVRNVRDLKNSMGSLNNTPFLDKQLQRLDQFHRKLKDVKKTADELRNGGFELTATGVATLAPIQMSLKQAGDFQAVQKDIGVSTYDKTVPESVRKANVDAVSNLSLQLGKDSVFNGTEVGLAMNELLRSGVDTKDVTGGAGAATIDLAQAGNVDTVTSALAMSKIGNAYSLQGSQYKELADYMARLDGASTAKIPTLMSGYKYASAYASTYDMNYKDIGLGLAVLNNRGLDESTAGTSLSNALAKLTPTTDPAFAAMEQLKLLNKDGTSKFFDDNGKAKDLLTIVKMLRESTKGMRDDSKMFLMRKIFEDEGARAMLLLMQEGKGSMEEVNAAISKQMSLQDRVKEKMTGLNGQIEQLKGSWETFLTTAGTPILDEATQSVQTIGSLVDRTAEWVQQNKELTGTLLTVGAYLGGTLLTLGAIKLASSAILYAWQGAKVLTKPVKWAADGAKWTRDKFRKNPVQEAAEKAGKSSNSNRTGTMIVRAARVYITGQLAGTGSGGNPGFGPDGNPLDSRNKPGKKTFRYGNKPNNIPSKTTWDTPELDTIKNASKIAKVAKIAGVVGTVASTGIAAYGMYQAAQQNGWKEAIANNGGSVAGGVVGGVVGGAIGTLAGPLGTAAGAYLGSTVGEKIGSWMDSSGVTKRMVDSVSETIDSIKGWWNGEDAQKAKKDMEGVRSNVANNTNQMGESLSSLQRESSGWGSGMMSMLAAGIRAAVPDVLGVASFAANQIRGAFADPPAQPAFLGPPAPPKYLGGSGGGNVQVTNRNTFNVYGPNPSETARRVDEKMSTPDKYLESRYPVGVR